MGLIAISTVPHGSAEIIYAWQPLPYISPAYFGNAFTVHYLIERVSSGTPLRLWGYTKQKAGIDLLTTDKQPKQDMKELQNL